MSSVEGLLLPVEQSVHLTQDNQVIQAHQLIGSQGCPSFWDRLFNNLDYNFEAVYHIIDSILTAKDRCEVASMYIQAIAIDNLVFLISNMDAFPHFKLTNVGRCWSIGRSSTCALMIPQATVDERHALIEFNRSTGYCVVDLGSHGGTWVNRRRIQAHERRPLRHGDMLELGEQLFEFFIDDFDQPQGWADNGPDTTYF